MLVLRMFPKGVPSSRDGEAIPRSGRVARLSNGVETFEGVVPAILAVRGVVMPARMFEWLGFGARVLGVFGLSYGMAQPLVVGSRYAFGARIIAFSCGWLAA